MLMPECMATIFYPFGEYRLVLENVLMLLADIFENFRNSCVNSRELLSRSRALLYCQISRGTPC